MARAKRSKRLASLLPLLFLGAIAMLGTEVNFWTDNKKRLLSELVQDFTMSLGNATDLSWDDWKMTLLGIEQDDEGDSTTEASSSQTMATNRLSILELSRQSNHNHNTKHNCTWPFVKAVDRIVDINNFTSSAYGGGRKIPRILHLAWIHDNPDGPNKGRCIHYQQAKTLEQWQKALPNFSIFLHDDYSVEQVLRQDLTPEFPQLSLLLKCVKMRNAMLIDIWRVLVLYRFG